MSFISFEPFGQTAAGTTQRKTRATRANHERLRYSSLFVERNLPRTLTAAPFGFGKLSQASRTIEPSHTHIHSHSLTFTSAAVRHRVYRCPGSPRPPPPDGRTREHNLTIKYPLPARPPKLSHSFSVSAATFAVNSFPPLAFTMAVYQRHRSLLQLHSAGRKKSLSIALSNLDREPLPPPRTLYPQRDPLRFAAPP